MSKFKKISNKLKLFKIKDNQILRTNLSTKYGSKEIKLMTLVSEVRFQVHVSLSKLFQEKIWLIYPKSKFVKRIQTTIFHLHVIFSFIDMKIPGHIGSSKSWDVVIRIVKWISRSGTIFLIIWGFIQKSGHIHVHIKMNWTVISHLLKEAIWINMFTVIKRNIWK